MYVSSGLDTIIYVGKIIDFNKFYHLISCALIFSVLLQSLHEFRIIEKMRMLIIAAFLALIAYNYMNYVPGYSYFVTGILFVHIKIIVLSVNIHFSSNKKRRLKLRHDLLSVV